MSWQTPFSPRCPAVRGWLVHRRTFLATGLAAAFAGPSIAWGAPATVQPGGAETVLQLALELSRKPFVPPARDAADAAKKLTYDQFRDIRFRPDKSIWRGAALGYELQLLPGGWIYDLPIEIDILDDGKLQPLTADPSYFSFGRLTEPLAKDVHLSLSGFRVHAPINRSDYLDEIVVFQGASYFRAVARGQVYGLSARGLCINTGQPEGEEFPIFRSFYIEKPGKDAPQIVIHALLDSPSTTGAYRFAIAPGNETTMDVEATLFPRTTLQHAGIAPLTSMFMHGSASLRRDSDFRPAVHDSEGLSIRNGLDERIWRPLTNPRTLQASAFLDHGPKGFGLEQRDRSFATFEDLEAHYERRPSLWVEPTSDWGDGSVQLLEIPASEEIHDNIVAYWSPAAPLQAGQSHRFTYRLSWCSSPPAAPAGLQASQTRMGITREGLILAVVDFAGPALAGLKALPAPDLTASAGAIAHLVVQPNEEIEGVRVSFTLDPQGAQLSELRLQLKSGGKAISETWLYRWTPV